MKPVEEWTEQEQYWYKEVMLKISYDSLQEAYPQWFEKEPDLDYMLEHETNSFKKEVIQEQIKIRIDNKPNELAKVQSELHKLKNQANDIKRQIKYSKNFMAKHQLQNQLDELNKEIQRRKINK